MAETPNRETRDAMAALEAGKGKRFDSAEKLFEDLAGGPGDVTDRDERHRREALENAIANVRLAGLEPDARTIAELEQVVTGGLDLSEVLDRAHARITNAGTKREGR